MFKIISFESALDTFTGDGIVSDHESRALMDLCKLAKVSPSQDFGFSKLLRLLSVIKEPDQLALVKGILSKSKISSWDLFLSADQRFDTVFNSVANLAFKHQKFSTQVALYRFRDQYYMAKYDISVKFLRTVICDLSHRPDPISLQKFERYKSMLALRLTAVANALLGEPRTITDGVTNQELFEVLADILKVWRPEHSLQISFGIGKKWDGKCRIELNSEPIHKSSTDFDTAVFRLEKFSGEPRDLLFFKLLGRISDYGVYCDRKFNIESSVQADQLVQLSESELVSRILTESTYPLYAASKALREILVAQDSERLQTWASEWLYQHDDGQWYLKGTTHTLVDLLTQPGDDGQDGFRLWLFGRSNPTGPWAGSGNINLCEQQNIAQILLAYGLHRNDIPQVFSAILPPIFKDPVDPELTALLADDGFICPVTGQMFLYPVELLEYASDGSALDQDRKVVDISGLLAAFQYLGVHAVTGERLTTLPSYQPRNDVLEKLQVKYQSLSTFLMRIKESQNWPFLWHLTNLLIPTGASDTRKAWSLLPFDTSPNVLIVSIFHAKQLAALKLGFKSLEIQVEFERTQYINTVQYNKEKYFRIPFALKNALAKYGIEYTSLQCSKTFMVEILKSELEGGPNFLVEGKTPSLTFAIEHGLIDAAKQLFDMGADVFLDSRKLPPPILMAVLRGQKELLQYFLSDETVRQKAKTYKYFGKYSLIQIALQTKQPEIAMELAVHFGLKSRSLGVFRRFFGGILPRT